jgi:putative flippase GtrA
MRHPAEKVGGWGRRLLTHEGGLVGEGFRFAAAGGSAALVYLGLTSFLAVVIGIPFEAALAIGFATALSLHFTLQRLFVWVHPENFALPMSQQVRRYLMVAATQYAITAASTLLLPSRLGLPAEAVYLLTVPCVTLANFLMFRHLVFHGATEQALPEKA